MPRAPEIRHASGRLVLEVEMLRGEIRSIERRDRSRLTADEVRRLERLRDRKLARLREVQHLLNRMTSLNA